MASHSTDNEPLKELKHDAVPGYMRVFVIAFAVMTIYLAIVLISSPGPAEGHHGHGDEQKHSPSSDAERHHETH